MPSDDSLTVSEAPAADRDRQDGHNLAVDRSLSRRTQGTHQHPQLRSLVAKHCEQLSSELLDAFRTEVEREVSEVIVSEATVFCEQLRSKEEALVAAETRCKGLQEQLELSNKTCHQLQERVSQLEATEAELRVALSERLEVCPGHLTLRITGFPFTRFSSSSGQGWYLHFLRWKAYI
jgi:hypothetical protein